MNFGRQAFRCVGIVLLLVLSACAHSRFSVLQGITTESTTQISVVVPKSAKLRFQLIDSVTGVETSVTSSRVIERDYSDWAVQKIRFNGLELGRDYEFRILNETNSILDRRELSPFRSKGESFRFAVASCMDDSFKEVQGPMWRQLLSHEPEALFLIGDNVYADRDVDFYKGPAPAEMIWNRYVETRQTLHLFHSKKLVPIVATWDDHDYGWNNGDRRYEHRVEAKSVFETFFAQEPEGAGWIRGPGVSGRWAVRGLNFLFMDNRTFRSPNLRPGEKDPLQTHWGREQEGWMLMELRRFRSPAWIVNGDQFFGAYHPYESYEGNHPLSFKQLLNQIRSTRRPVAFLSGDRHLIELIQVNEEVLGYETFELTTSAIHAKTFPGSFNEFPNPAQIEGVDDTFNYSLIETQSRTATRMEVRIQGMGPDNEVLFDENLTVRTPH